MKTKLKIIGIIPARGGSKSIKLKNIIKINNKPLLHYTAIEALKSKYIQDTYISTDNKKIAKVAVNEGLKFLGFRPKYLSNDKSRSIDSITHLINKIRVKYKYKPDLIVILQPTSPLRKAIHIDNAIKLYLKYKPSSVVSVVEVPHNYNPESIMKINSKKYLEGVKKKLNEQKTNRHQKKTYIARNGAAIYIVPYDTLINKKSLFGNRPFPYLMDKISSIDIDDKEDLYLAESVIKNS